MIDYRKLARGQECQIREPGVCNFDTTTTVLAHVRIIGISGMGHKVPDLLASWACSDCHAWCDSGASPKMERDLSLLRGMARTQAALIRMGKL